MHPTILRLSLTVLTGALAACSYVVSKLLMMHGLDTVSVAMVKVSGAAILIIGVLLAGGGRLMLTPNALRFYAIGAVVGVGGVQLLGNWAVARVPVGLFTTILTLSPLFTCVLKALVERRMPAPRAVAGTLLGLLGVTAVLLPRASAAQGGEAIALIACLAIPLIFAAGNLYRERFWPDGMNAGMAAGGTMWVQLCVVIPLFFMTHSPGQPAIMSAQWPLALLLVVVGSAALVTGAALQRVADSISFSQTGYASALTGMVASAIVFNDRLEPLFWPALLAVFAGVYLTTTATRNNVAETHGSLAMPTLAPSP